MYDTITAGQLREILADLPDDIEIFLDDGMSGTAMELPGLRVNIVKPAGCPAKVAVLSYNGEEAECVLEQTPGLPGGYRLSTDDLDDDWD